MSNLENVPTIEMDETHESRSYTFARSFIKDFSPVVFVPYCASFCIYWNKVAVDLFVKEGNEVKEAERPVWLKSWPMTSESLKRDIVSVLKKEGRPPLNVEESSSVLYVTANTSAEAKRVLDMLETIEKDSFMQQVMKTVLKAPKADELAHIYISNEEQDEGLIGLCVLPSGSVHLFNRGKDFSSFYIIDFH